MNHQLLNDVLMLIALCTCIALFISAGTYWYRHYSNYAKSLSNRLNAIVNIRSHLDEQLVKSDTEQFEAFQRIALTTQLAESIKLMILRSGINITVAKLLTISLSVALSCLLILTTFTHASSLSLLLFSLILGTLPFLYVKHKEQKRRAQIEKQLPEALDFVCRSLRAGHGLAVSFGMVGDELPNPISQEFKNVFEEINFGLPFNEAMANFAVRTNSGDINFLVVGLLIQREAGGNLIELLENLAKTIRDRMILAGKVRVLASEGKYSGIMLCILPFLLGGILSFMNPAYMSILWTSESGQHLIQFSLLMMVIGGLWMWNITRIKV